MKVVIHPTYTYLTDFINRLPSNFDREGCLLYQGRNTVKRYDVNGVSLVVKKYKHPNIIQRISYTFFKSSKTERAYRFAALLRAKHIDSPHEVAYIETKSHGLFSTGYFVSLHCADPAASSLIQDEDGNQPLMQALAAFLADMHQKGVLHRDLNLNNILCHVAGTGQFHFTLIDTNRAMFKQTTPAECLNDLKRLTHKRGLLMRLIALYAQARNWDAADSMQRVLHLLDQFEDQRRIKRKFQDLIGIRHS